MSQLLEAPTPAFGNLPPKPNEQGFVGPDQQGFDIVKILWRWKWLPILGAVVGATLGVLVFMKMPAQYEAKALVQVLESRPMMAGNMQGLDPVEMMGSITRTDESMVIRSQAVLSKAVRMGLLVERQSFQGKSEPEIISELLGSRDLAIQPADKDAKTTLVEISYICNNAEDAGTVVSSIVRAYTEYLSEEFKNVGDEVYDVVSMAQDKLQDEFKRLQKRNVEFRMNAKGIIWNGEAPTDPYYETYVGQHAQLQQLKAEKLTIKSMLSQVDEGRTAGRSPEQFLLLLAQSNMRDLMEPINPQRLRQQTMQAPVEMRVDTESAKLERTLLFPLQTRERELLDTVGEGHPTIASVRKKITLTQEEIAKLKEREKMVEQEIGRMIEQAEEMLPGGMSIEDQLRVRVDALKEKYAALEKQEVELEELAAESLTKSQALRGVIENHTLQTAELEAVQKLLESVASKVNAIELLPPAGHRTLKELNAAPAAGGYYGPTLPPYLLGGAAVGFILLSGIAVLMDLADRSYRSPDEISADLGIPVLGHIPIIDTQKVKRTVEMVDPSLATIHHSRGRASEAFRSVRTSLFFSSRASELKVIQVTSPVPGDGKSTLSSNLAVTMAQSGRRVLLIDADFRRPRIAKIFGIDTDVGMAQVVAGRAELDEATYTSCVANLSIMPGGRRPNNPAELLSSHRFRELLDVLREKFDMIIIDTPPLLAVSEPSAVAALVDGVVLTMRLRRNVKPLATRASRVLDAVDARLLGVVVNGVSGEAGYGYTYGYNDYRYAYRYGGNYRYGYKYGYKYGYGGKYGSYSAGYIEDSQESANPRDGEQARS